MTGDAPTSPHAPSTYCCVLYRQAKAGLIEEAVATAALMQQQGITLATRTLNVLLSACARAGQPHRAEALLEEMTARHGEMDDCWLVVLRPMRV